LGPATRLSWRERIERSLHEKLQLASPTWELHAREMDRSGRSFLFLSLDWPSIVTEWISKLGWTHVRGSGHRDDVCVWQGMGGRIEATDSVGGPAWGSST
jgi:hypothetical protein